jgi:hypothetical protein
MKYILVILTMAAPKVFANSELLGSWKLVKSECLSGNTKPQDEEVKMTLRVLSKKEAVVNLVINDKTETCFQNHKSSIEIKGSELLIKSSYLEATNCSYRKQDIGEIDVNPTVITFEITGDKMKTATPTDTNDDVFCAKGDAAIGTFVRVTE